MPKMWAKHDTREKKRDNKMGMQPNMLLRFQFLPKSKCGKSGDFEIGLWSLAGTGFETGATERALTQATINRRQLLLDLLYLWCCLWNIILALDHNHLPGTSIIALVSRYNLYKLQTQAFV